MAIPRWLVGPDVRALGKGLGGIAPKTWLLARLSQHIAHCSNILVKKENLDEESTLLEKRIDTKIEGLVYPPGGLRIDKGKFRFVL